jgi:hypothetical protein
VERVEAGQAFQQPVYREVVVRHPERGDDVSAGGEAGAADFGESGTGGRLRGGGGCDGGGGSGGGDAAAEPAAVRDSGGDDYGRG